MKTQILLSPILIPPSPAEPPVHPGRTNNQFLTAEERDHIPNSPVRSNSNIMKPGPQDVPAVAGAASVDSNQQPDKTRYQSDNSGCFTGFTKRF